MIMITKRLSLLKGSAALMIAGSLLFLPACSDQSSPKGNDADAQETALISPELGEFGIDLTAQNTSVDPGDDFNLFANGTWIENFEIPADRTNYGAFTTLAERSESQIKKIIDDLSAETETEQGSAAQRVRDYYNSYMDVETINKRGLKPIQPLIDQIAAITTREELILAFGAYRVNGTSSPITFSTDINRENPDQYQMSVSMAGLNLGDRDFYLNDDEASVQKREDYLAHIAEMFELAQIPGGAEKAKAILQLETKIAEVQWSRADRRDLTKTNNPISLADLKSEYSAFPWDDFLSAGGYPDFDTVNVRYPDTLPVLTSLALEGDLQVWKDYLTYEALNNHASLLSEDISTASWRFYGQTLSGQKEQRERWKRGVSRVSGLNSLGLDLGKIYIERYFEPDAKAEMEKLVANLKKSIGQRINDLDWMSAPTKKKALEKLSTFRTKIAYPDDWKLLDVVIEEGKLFENAIAIRQANIKKDDEDFGKPTDKDAWFMTPQTVNAYYNPPFNEIVFPAAILQPPFFDLYADPAVNYGGIGAVIGHEIGHGFDDQGSKFDAYGVQSNWWTAEDRVAFEALADKLVEQYNGYEAVPGKFVDGRFTLGENIGDVGGLSMAYHAYKLSLNGEEAPIINGLTGDQRFFLAWAQVWKRKYRDTFLERILKLDPHSPSAFRINGVVRNMDAWYEAFNVDKDDALYLAPENRVTIW